MKKSDRFDGFTVNVFLDGKEKGVRSGLGNKLKRRVEKM